MATRSRSTSKVIDQKHPLKQKEELVVVLEKKGRGTFYCPWHVRTFKLNGQDLLYYDEEKKKGFINLDGSKSQSVESSEADNKDYPFVIETVEGERIFLNANDDSVRLKCIDIFNFAAKGRGWEKLDEKNDSEVNEVHTYMRDRHASLSRSIAEKYKDQLQNNTSKQEPIISSKSRHSTTKKAPHEGLSVISEVDTERQASQEQIRKSKSESETIATTTTTINDDLNSSTASTDTDVSTSFDSLRRRSKTKSRRLSIQEKKMLASLPPISRIFSARRHGATYIEEDAAAIVIQRWFKRMIERRKGKLSKIISKVKKYISKDKDKN